MIQIIIFSFNRAIQLDTLLYSIKKYWKSPYYEIDVVYNCSSDSFQKGYDYLIQKYSADRMISFHKEQKGECRYTWKELLNPYNLKRLYKYPYLRKPKTNFRSLTNTLMEKSDAREVMFMTDDSLFINPVCLSSSIFDWIEEEPTKRQFSLRISKGMDNQPSIGVSEDNGILSWNMNDMKRMNNWGYQFSVDAHIYNKECILQLFKIYNFCNPNSLEGYICNIVRRKGWFNQAKSFATPHLLSFPINMVQDVEENESLGVSPEMMNNYYLSGHVLEYQMPKEIRTFQVYPEEIYFCKNQSKETVRIKN